MEELETVVANFEGPIHVSLKQVKNTVPEATYKMLFSKFDFITAREKGTQGVRIQLGFDKVAHPEYAKRFVYDRLWLTPEAINIYTTFVVQCGIPLEMLREEEVPGQFNTDGSPVTVCAYSVEDQLKAIYGASVYAKVIEVQIDGIAADGVTPEKRWINNIQTRSYTKV